MPSLTISDGTNLALDVTPNSTSALVKYFKNLSNLSVDGALIALKSGMSLADPTVKSISSGVTFAQPVDLGTSEVELKVGGGISGSLSIFVPGQAGLDLFDTDPYGDPIKVNPDDRYVSFGFKATVTTALTGATGDLKFGFSSGGSVSLANYRLFSIKPTAPELIDAVCQTVGGFSIPADIEDLAALNQGEVITIDGTGSLKFSASANLLAAVNPLASASLPAPLPTVAIKGGGSITVGADVQLTGEYQLRVLKVADTKIRLGYYRKKTGSLDVKATSSLGLTANIGDSDVIPMLMSAISADAKADKDELAKAGLKDSDIQNIEDAIKAAISRTLEIAISAELDATQEESSAFLYEIDLGSLTASSRTAIHSALDGDLSALTTNPSSLPGIVAVRDIFESLRERKYSLHINLLGVVNYGWVSKLITQGKTIYEPTTGQLVIADSSTASRISTTIANIGVADAEKLRRVLAENFLITIAYRGARSAGLAPALTSSHSFFALNQHTSQETLRDELDVSVGLGLVDPSKAAALVSGAPEFGRTLYYTATNYDGALSASLFLDGDKPRPVEYYEQAGLQAIALLVHAEDMDSARLVPTRDADLCRAARYQGTIPENS